MLHTPRTLGTELFGIEPAAPAHETEVSLQVGNVVFNLMG